MHIGGGENMQGQETKHIETIVETDQHQIGTSNEITGWQSSCQMNVIPHSEY